MMEKNIWIFPHPSISADSSISLGISFIKLVRINTEIGTANAIYGPISAQMLSYSPVALDILNTGISVICTGMDIHATIAA